MEGKYLWMILELTKKDRKRDLQILQDFLLTKYQLDPENIKNELDEILMDVMCEKCHCNKAVKEVFLVRDFGFKQIGFKRKLCSVCL